MLFKYLALLPVLALADILSVTSSTSCRTQYGATSVLNVPTTNTKVTRSHFASVGATTTTPSTTLTVTPRTSTTSVTASSATVLTLTTTTGTTTYTTSVADAFTATSTRTFIRTTTTTTTTTSISTSISNTFKKRQGTTSYPTLVQCATFVDVYDSKTFTSTAPTPVVTLATSVTTISATVTSTSTATATSVSVSVIVSQTTTTLTSSTTLTTTSTSITLTVSQTSSTTTTIAFASPTTECEIYVNQNGPDYTAEDTTGQTQTYVLSCDMGETTTNAAGNSIILQVIPNVGSVESCADRCLGYNNQTPAPATQCAAVNYANSRTPQGQASPLPKPGDCQLLSAEGTTGTGATLVVNGQYDYAQPM